MKPAPRVLYCHCAHADVIPAETRARILEALAASGAPYEAVADLCELAARKDPMLARLAATPGLQIVACWPRTVRWLFDAAGAPLAADAAIHNMRKDSAEVILADAALPTRLRGGSGDPPRGAERAEKPRLGKSKTQLGEPAVPQFPAKKPGEWIPWFPVLDYDRCKNCRQCLQFCLFGVYTEDEAGKVRVAAPEKCKTGCPACARLCPHVAIIFPKYEGGAISGDDALPAAAAADAGRPQTPIDFSSLAGLDLHEALKRRQAILRAAQSAAQGGMPRPSLPGHVDAPPPQACPRKDGVGMPPGQQGTPPDQRGMPPGQRGTPPDRSGDPHE